MRMLVHLNYMEQLQDVIAQLGIDKSILFLFMMMVVFYYAFSAVYLKPYQKLLEERKLKTTGSMEGEMLAAIEEKTENYTERLWSVNAEVRQTINAAEVDAKKEESKILEDATVQAKAIVQQEITKLEKNKVALLKEMEAEVPAISAAIAEKVLGRKFNGRV